MRYMDKSFHVAQSGNNAKQWPKCGKDCSFVFLRTGVATDHVFEGECVLEFGHKGDCKPTEKE